MGERALKPGWRWVKFGDVVRLNRETCKDPEAEGIDRVIGLEHIEPGDLRVRAWADIADGTTFTNRVRPGQVLFGKRRAYQRKVAVADFDAVCSGDIYVFESADPGQLLPELLPFICQTDSFFDHAVGTSAGSLSPRTNWSSLKDYQFALPAIAEQSRVLELLGVIERAWRSADFVAGCARIAFHSTLEHIYQTAAASHDHRPLVNLMDSNRPITYGILMPGTGHPGGVPVVKVKDFPSGEIEESDLLLTSPEIANSYKRSELRANDILVSIRGTIGRVAVVPASLEGANITQDTARLSFHPDINANFARAMLECASMQRAMHSNIPPPAPAGQPPAKAKPRPTIQGLNIGQLRKVKMPTPARSIQDEFAEVADLARKAMLDSEVRADHMRRLRQDAIHTALRVGA